MINAKDMPATLTTEEGIELESKIVYQTLEDGLYVGETLAYESPQDKLEGRPRVWLIPAGCVENPPPPPAIGGKNIYWTGTEWEYRDVPVPEEPEIPPRTPEQIYNDNLMTKRQLLSIAALEIAPLQDAVDFGEATPTEEALLNEWKQYRIAVNRVDLTIENPNWPIQPNAQQ